MSPINTNKAADIYYRKSADALLQAFLNAAIREVRKHYDTVYSSNAADTKKEKPIKSVSAVSLAILELKGRKLDMFTGKAEQIVFRYVGKVGKQAKNNVQSVLERFGVITIDNINSKLIIKQ